MPHRNDHRLISWACIIRFWYESGPQESASSEGMASPNKRHRSKTVLRPRIILPPIHPAILRYCSTSQCPHAKGAHFVWTQECIKAFEALKQHLVQAPVLLYPQFGTQASSSFLLQTDTSAVGLGVVLEQGGYVIAYASRSLTAPERQYSAIQRECLAVVYALKQFRHYLLGRRFQLVTDHAPLQWLSAQKMEGMLCRWALAMQEYNFQIVYRKWVLNGNADVLSRLPSSPCAIPPYSPSDL